MEKLFIIGTVCTLGVTGFVGLERIAVSFLTAQGAAAPSEIVGTTGWVGAGLLGLVLAWLLGIHLPAKDKQIKEIIDGKDLMVKAITEIKDSQIREMLAQGKSTLEAKDKSYETLLLMKDKQLEAKDAQMELQRKEHGLTIKLVSDEYRSTIKDITVALSGSLRKNQLRIEHKQDKSGGGHGRATSDRSDGEDESAGS